MTVDDKESAAEREKRTALLTTAALYRNGHEVASVRVRNLSATGLGGASSEPLEKGATYSVMLKGLGRVPGEVVWIQGIRFGMHFDEEIDLAQLKIPGISEAKLPEGPNFYNDLSKNNDYRRPGFRSRK